MELILLGLAIILPLLAQSSISSAYNTYAKTSNTRGLTGKVVAKRMLERNGLHNVRISCISGNLSDHYDPRYKQVNLSESIYSDDSIASLAVAAHECGHAIQDKEKYVFLNFRSALVPVVNFTSKLSTIFLFIGIVTAATKLFTIGIILLLGGLLFQLVTLPVEFNASSRALKQLEELGLVNSKDLQGTKKVLKAAALTYVAGFLSTALQIVRLTMLNNRR